MGQNIVSKNLIFCVLQEFAEILEGFLIFRQNPRVRERELW